MSDDLVRYIVHGLVGDDVEVSIEEESTPSERILHLDLPEALRGAVIGRQGRTIRALETILAAAPTPDGRRTALKVAGR